MKLAIMKYAILDYKVKNLFRFFLAILSTILSDFDTCDLQLKTRKKLFFVDYEFCDFKVCDFKLSPFWSI